MKKIVLGILLGLFAVNMSAQPPQGMGGGRPDGPPPGGRGGDQFNSRTEEKITLEVFPDIPNLTLKQREKVGSILTKEAKDIRSQMDKKRELDIESRNTDLSEKDIEKHHKKINKIDEKINDIRGKSDKKIRKELSAEQYSIFTKKRSEFKFKHEKGMPQHRNNRMERPPFEGQMSEGSFE